MTMADIMFSHSRLYESLAVAHCNFHLRPGDCDEDEKLVSDWAAERGLPFYRKDFDTEAYAHEHGVSIEMAARDLRYAWFAALCAEHGYDAVAVAHNANDNAETLVLNLVRGTGLKGLTGMSDCGRLTSVGTVELTVLRPIMGMTRREIEDYAAVHHVAFRTDKTNLENDYKRNKVRNLVFPVFEQMNPSFIKTMASDIRHFSAAADIVDDWCAERRPLVMASENEVSVPALLAQSHWEYLLYTILSDFGFNESVVDSVCQLLKSPDKTLSGKKFRSQSYLLVTSTDKLIVTPVSAGMTTERLCHPRHYKRGDRSEAIGGVCGADVLSVVIPADLEILPYNIGMDLKCEEGTIVFDADKVPEDAVVREWQAGDWLVPFGMKGRKKLSDLFTDLHYDLLRKQEALVLAPADPEDHHVFAVLGVKIDDSIKVTSDTKRIARSSR